MVVVAYGRCLCFSVMCYYDRILQLRPYDFIVWFYRPSLVAYLGCYYLRPYFSSLPPLNLLKVDHLTFTNRFSKVDQHLLNDYCSKSDTFIPNAPTSLSYNHRKRDKSRRTSSNRMLAWSEGKHPRTYWTVIVRRLCFIVVLLRSFNKCLVIFSGTHLVRS